MPCVHVTIFSDAENVDLLAKKYWRKEGGFVGRLPHECACIHTLINSLFRGPAGVRGDGADGDAVPDPRPEGRGPRGGRLPSAGRTAPPAAAAPPRTRGAPGVRVRHEVPPLHGLSAGQFPRLGAEDRNHHQTGNVKNSILRKTAIEPQTYVQVSLLLKTESCTRRCASLWNKNLAHFHKK